MATNISKTSESTKKSASFGVDLKSFRERNGLKQSDVADIIKSKTSFISMIESGASKFPKDKLELIIAYAGCNDLDVDSLLPAFHRLKAALKYLEKKKIKSPVSPQLLDNLQWGKEELTPQIASEVCERCDDINKDWLLTGAGEMLVEKLPVSNEELFESIKHSIALIENLRSEVRELKAITEQILTKM